MKKGLLFIVLFVAWCILGAIWYVFWVKGIADDPAHFQPHPTFQAIIEITLLLLGAFLFGFGVAWRARAESIETLADELRTARYDVADFQKEAAVKAKLHEEATQALADAVTNMNDARASREALAGENAALKEQLSGAAQKVAASESRVSLIDGELNAAKFRIRLLENDVTEKQTTIAKLTHDLEQLSAQPQHRDWSDHPFVRPVPADDDDRDDLTEIKGIGPSFQKKLNSLDIFTFRQLSELSGESVERLAEVIEVFPDRIHRDNWIGQATKLYLRKIGRES